MFLSKAADIVNGKIHGVNVEISGIFIDSRALPDEAAIFFAIQGERHDGHNYVNELYSKGIRAFVVNRRFDEDKFPLAGFILVDDTLRALQDFAAEHRSHFEYPVVGITGSNGKTCVKEWIYQLLHERMQVVRNPKSYNSQVGVPLSIMLMNNSAEIAVFEAGISLPDEMRRLEHVIRPTTGIFTNLGDAHQEGFASQQEKLAEKMILFERVKMLIYCADHKQVHDFVVNSKHEYATFTWGQTPECDLQIIDKHLSRDKRSTDVRLSFRGEEFSIHIPFSDNGSVENALHCTALALTLGFSPQYIADKTGRLAPVAMRLELKKGINGCTIINDTYNSDVNSLSIALDFLSGMTQHQNKTLILSDILQSGENERELYAKVAGLVSSKGVNKFIGTGPALAVNADLFAGIANCSFYADTDSFIRQFPKHSFDSEAVLLKGSRAFEFERISRLLEYKTHQTILEINLNALVNNINYFKSKLKHGVKLMAMVKAFSYGAGTHELASLLQYQRIDYLAVAYADEGVELREAGISMPIVVLNANPDSFDTMVLHRLEPEIYSFRALREFAASTGRAGIIAYPVHIKIDTGMHRLGFSEHELFDLCKMLNEYKELKVASVFSHLAASGEEIHDGFTETQIEIFRRSCRIIEQKTGYSFLKHILNSSGIERFPHAQFDMVRLGIGLYGIGSTPESREKLQNVGTLSSAIVQIREVQAGETVGYGRHGKINENRRIATVPIGYADGLNRKLSCGHGYFMVKGKPAPVVGNICMDACMIDITGIDAEEGDRVIIFGEKPTVSEIAETLGTIPYEVLTGISQRVKRIYYQ